jgi:hypothetical protein
VPFIVSTDDLMDIGAPVTEEYETPQGRFTGNIAWVQVNIGKDAFGDAAGSIVPANARYGWLTKTVSTCGSPTPGRRSH